MILRFAVAVVVFWLAFDGGTYGLESRNSLAIALWWALIVALALGLLPVARVTRPALATGGLLAALAVVTVASMAWAASAEKAFTEFNRVALYLAVFALVATASRRANVAQWAEGIAIGLAGVGVVALASRLFPEVFPAGDIPRFLPSAATRLSYPVGYWNGLAILLALGLPLLYRVAVTARALVVRGLAVAVVPVFAAVTYLASSRGGFAVAAVASAAFLALTARRWRAAGAVAVALLGSAVAVAVLVPRTELVNGPLDSGIAASQGRSAALLIVLACAVTGLGYAFATRYLPRLVRPGRLAGRLAAASVAVTALAGIAASNPVERFETFKDPPTGVAGAERDFVKAHLLSGNGSGRWQFWSAAVDEFESAPLIGRGAGSYEAWWAQHGDIPMFVRDAHSLYLETMGELGVVGFLLLGAALASGVVALAGRILRVRDDDRVTVAALGAAFLAFLLALAIDWMWELTVVSIVGVAVLGLLTGPATTPAQRPRGLGETGSATGPPRRSRRHLAAGIAFLVAAWLVVVAEAIPLLSQLKIDDSQAAVRRGDGGDALEDVHAARNLQPWAASPYLQLALVEEQMGDLEAARTAIADAVERDERDWRLWLVQARIETKLGLIPEARESIAHAAALNPRSPLFAEVQGIG